MNDFGDVRPGVLSVAVGAGALVGQALIVRELMVSFYGTEPAIAAVLCTWLATVACGAALGGFVVRRMGRERGLCIAAALAVGIGVWPAWLLARLARCVLRAQVGAFLPVGAMVLGAAAASLPCALAVGFFFPCAAAVAEQGESRSGTGTGRVYLFEAVGSAASGALLSLVLLGLIGPAAILAFVSGIVLLAVALAAGPRRPLRLAIGCLGAGVVAVGLQFGPALDTRTAQMRWSTVTTFRRAGFVSTRYQYVELGVRQGEYILVSNGRIADQFPDRAAARQQAALILTQHPGPDQVLLVGGGLTGLCQALLGAPIEQLDYVEPDPRAMAFTLQALPAQDRAALQDPRFHAASEDGRSFVRRAVASGRRYDIVCLNVGDPASAAESRFYTVDFLRQVAGGLEPNGVLAVAGITGSANYLDRGVARDYGACLYATLRGVFSHVVVSPGEDLCFFAAQAPGVVTADSDTIAQRFDAMGLEPALMRLALVAEAFPAERVAATRAALSGRAGDVPLNTDRRPVLFAWFLALQGAYADESRPVTAAAPRAPTPAALLAALAVAGALGMLVCVGAVRRRGGPGRSAPLSAGVAVFTTGAFGLTAELLIIYGYQVTFGFVYRDVALLTGLFMLGLSCGAVFVLRGRRVPPRRLLITAEAGQAIFALLMPVLAGAAWAAPAVFAAASLGAGVLTGLVFPSAAAVALAAGVRPATAAGRLDAADHSGAVLGAATAGLLLLPMLGLGITALLLASLKVVSLACLFAGGQPPRAPGLDGPQARA